MIAVLGNSTTADRLRGGLRAPDVGDTSNSRVKFHKNRLVPFSGFNPPPILTSAPRYTVCRYLAMIDYQRLSRKRGGFGHRILPSCVIE